MIKDITIGQYIYKDSFVHKLDPRTKILISMFFMFGIFLINNITEYVYVLLLTAMTIYMSQIPLMKIIKGLKPILPLMILTVIMNAFFTSGTTLFSWAFIRITREGLYLAGFMGIRIFFLIIFTSLLTLTTSPITLTNGIEGLLTPLKKFKVPAHEIAMMMSIALRFIPTLIDETDKIMKAQKARGADFESGNIIKKTKSLVPILIPLFISAFTRADELAMAMEARGYRGDEGRTKFKELKYRLADKVILFLFAVLLVFLIIRKIAL
ncbi:MAG: cobalt/nickel transport system permease protein [Fusobacteria bacterium]|nr:MAG: cobalt/nickel transport system permease protein [Fusobacteriota bacterium]KAF0228079.1 MAG: cobalt/nickel transport system permease [Fusobacteriota bacterium]